MWWALGGLLLSIAVLVCIVVLAQLRGQDKAERREAEADREKLRAVQEATNEPLPTDPDDVADLLRDA